MDCSESPAETIFFTNSGAGTCQGKFEAVCGLSEVSLTRYEDYSCQGGKEDGYPMSFTKSCGYANSLGFSKYGYASCSESSSDTSETTEGVTEVLEANTGNHNHIPYHSSLLFYSHTTLWKRPPQL